MFPRWFVDQEGFEYAQPGVSWSGPIDLAGFIEETDGTAAADAPAQDYSKISSADINQGGRNDGFLRWVILENVANDRSRLPDAGVSRSRWTGLGWLGWSVAGEVGVPGA